MRSNLGILRLYQGRRDEAEELFRAALRDYEELATPADRSRTLHNLSLIHI